MNIDLFSTTSSTPQVILYDPSGSAVAAQTLGAEHTSHMFSGLTPGRLYRTEVITHSGELTNSGAVLGRTGEQTVFIFIWVGGAKSFTPLSLLQLRSRPHTCPSSRAGQTTTRQCS